MRSAAPLEPSLRTAADLLWPVDRIGWRDGLVRGVVLTILGTCLLTVSAKVQVPGPVPMTLQTLAVLALGALLGARLAVSSVLLYLAEGMAGLPIFAGTPPAPAGLGYLMGPTGGFLAGFVVAAGLVGLAADRGWARRPVAFAATLACASAAMLACGWLWLAAGMSLAGSGTGLGFARAFDLGVKPFLAAEGIKLALAVVALPLLLKGLSRIVRG